MTAMASRSWVVWIILKKGCFGDNIKSTVVSFVEMFLRSSRLSSWSSENYREINSVILKTFVERSIIIYP